jgi:hypothetical protein
VKQVIIGAYGAPNPIVNLVVQLIFQNLNLVHFNYFQVWSKSRSMPGAGVPNLAAFINSFPYTSTDGFNVSDIILGAIAKVIGWANWKVSWLTQNVQTLDVCYV